MFNSNVLAVVFPFQIKINQNLKVISNKLKTRSNIDTYQKLMIITIVLLTLYIFHFCELMTWDSTFRFIRNSKYILFLFFDRKFNCKRIFLKHKYAEYFYNFSDYDISFFLLELVREKHMALKVLD